MRLLFLSNYTNFRGAMSISSKTNITMMVICMRKFRNKLYINMTSKFS